MKARILGYLALTAAVYGLGCSKAKEDIVQPSAIESCLQDREVTGSAPDNKLIDSGSQVSEHSLSLEERLFRDVSNGILGSDITEGTLISLGVETEEELNRYKTIIDKIYNRINRHLPAHASDTRKARFLYNQLSRIFDYDYFDEEQFSLTTFLDRYQKGKKAKWNCSVSSTLFYLLGIRLGLSTVPVEAMFKQMPHILSSLRIGEREIYVDLADWGRFESSPHQYVHPRQMTPVQFLANNYCMQGRSLLSQGNYVQATPYFEKTLGLDPTHVIAYNNLGLCYMATGRYEEALRKYEEGLRLEPNNQFLKRNKTRCQKRIKEKAQFEEIIRTKK